MAYRIEGKDIVINGFEQGIAETPYQGIADMRNIDTVSIPGEAMVNFSETPIAAPPVYNAVAFTAQNTGDTITVATTAGLYTGCAIVLNTNSAGGITTGVVYYVGNITATTFQIWLMPSQLGAAIAVTSDGSGTLTTYQYGRQRAVGSDAPKAYFVSQDTNPIGIFLLDASNYAWAILPEAFGSASANSLIFLGNIGGVGATSAGAGIVVWNGYLILLDVQNQTTDIGEVNDLFTVGPAGEWDYAWESVSVANNPKTLVGQEDGNMYFTSTLGVGSLIEEPGAVFDPTDTTTYVITSEAVLVPSNDKSVCIAELGTNMYIGGTSAFVYVWDKLSLGFNQILSIPENFTSQLVATSQNVFIFAGNRGRIYITNGAAAEVWKKIPDYITGQISPFIRWRAATYSRGQIVFSFTATKNDGTEITTVNGAWAIDINTKALRLLNKITNSGYSGITHMIAEMPRTNQTSQTPPAGTGLVLGWRISTTTYGIDRAQSTPYSAAESYIETDMIPVGTYLNPLTPTQIEWKTSVPIGTNGSETISVYYRLNMQDSFTLLGTSTSTSGTINGVTAISDLYKANFQKAQWVQFKIEMSANATTPTYCRLTELRLRDYPN